MDQLYDTTFEAVDSASGNCSVFVIAMKVGKIAFFEFHTYVSLLDEYKIPNYKGFVLLGYNIPAREFFNINHNAGHDGLINYLHHIYKLDVARGVGVLRELGVESTSNIQHPHIWTLLNTAHSDYVHNLFQHMAKNQSGQDVD